MTRKVCIVTGASSGLGLVTATVMAELGAHTILACRSKEKTEPILAAIKDHSKNDKVEFIELNLSSFKAIRKFVSEFKERDLPVHILINNAGVSANASLTEDGFEGIFGVNHLGHFLLSYLLIDKLKEGSPSRVVNISSAAHVKSPPINYDTIRTVCTGPGATFTAYRISKLANVMMSKELTRRYKKYDVLGYSLHPGVVATDIWRMLPNWLTFLPKQFMKSAHQGAKTILHCALEPELEKLAGQYFEDGKPVKCSVIAGDKEKCRELWEKSLGYVEETTDGTSSKSTTDSTETSEYFISDPML